MMPEGENWNTYPNWSKCSCVSGWGRWILHFVFVTLLSLFLQELAKNGFNASYEIIPEMDHFEPVERLVEEDNIVTKVGSNDNSSDWLVQLLRPIGWKIVHFVVRAGILFLVVHPSRILHVLGARLHFLKVGVKQQQMFNLTILLFFYALFGDWNTWLQQNKII